MEKLCYGCFKEYSDTNKQCPFCGYDNTVDKEHYPMRLQNGVILKKHYQLGKVLGQGSAGIVYLAQETVTKQFVAIREFFPSNLVTRRKNGTVDVISDDKRDDFNQGKTLFLQDVAKILPLKNKNLAMVRELFEEYGTAYYAMEYISGSDLNDYIQDHEGRLTVDTALKIAFPVMSALKAMHSSGLIHRNVSPDTIYITEDKEVKLLAYSATRYNIGNSTKTLDVVLTDGFAPIEQYSRHLKCGAYTDVYALCATIYYLITGKKPYDALNRMQEDLLVPPSALGTSIEGHREKALMQGLALKPQDRYQTIAELQRELVANPGDNPVSGTRSIPTEQERNLDNDSENTIEIILQRMTESAEARRKTALILSLVFGIILSLGWAIELYLFEFKKETREKNAVTVSIEDVNRAEESPLADMEFR